MKWLDEARKHHGLREVPGKGDNPIIKGWLIELRAAWRDDLTAWCGTFVAHCFRIAGKPLPTHWYRALAWKEWGKQLMHPVVGCVAVFIRKGGGHVAFVVGQDARGNLLCLGGNQGDAVSIAAFDRARVQAYVWPADEPLPAPLEPLPVLKLSAALSRNEA